jgi:hypothetical protein
MALQTLASVDIPRMFYATNQIIGYTINNATTANKVAAATFQAPASGDITKVIFRTSTVTQCTNGVSVSIQALDASGNPDGTPIGTAKTGIAVAASTTYEVSDTLTATVVKGTWYAAVVEFTSFAAGDSLNIVSQSNETSYYGIPYVNHYTASAWAKSRYPAFCGIGYGATYYDIGSALWFTNSEVSYHSGTGSFNRYGLRFQLPYPTTAIGCWWMGYCAAGANYTIGIGAETVAVDGDVRATGSSRQHHRILFSTPVAIAKDTAYKLIIYPTTTNAITLTCLDVGAVGRLDCLPCGQAFYRVKNLDGGADTEETTIRPLMGIITNQFDDGTAAPGSGGGLPILGGSIVR